MKLAGTRLRSLPLRKGLTVETKAGPVWNGRVRMNEEWLTQPLRWRRPRKIFVCAHGDLFAENVPDEWIDRVFAVMALAPQHTFQVLTKRAARMRKWFEERWQPTPAQRIEFPGLPAFDMPAQSEGDDRHERVFQAAGEFLDLDTVSDRFWNPDGSRKWPGWPLPNVWLGVSAEDQRRADERVPALLATPAAVRFVSAEPLLGPITFSDWWLAKPTRCESCDGDGRGGRSLRWCPNGACPHDGDVPRLDWIIAGGESGPGARPMHPEWARQIRDACADAGVAFHYKQAGAWAALAPDGGSWPDDADPFIRLRVDGSRGPDGWPMQRVGKKVAGRNLDGVTHDAFPEARA